MGNLGGTNMLMIVEDMIKEHQDSKNFKKWYGLIKDSIAEIVGEDNSGKMMQYRMLELAEGIVFVNEDDMNHTTAYLDEMYKNMFETVLEPDYDFCLDAFSSKSNEYIEFMKYYRVEQNPSVINTGSFWLKKFDSLADDIEETINLMNILIQFVSWTYSFTYAFVNQYMVENVGVLRFDYMKYLPVNYWVLKEIEELLDNYDFSANNCADSLCEYKEELLQELVKSGIFIARAIKITHRVRIGKGLSESMRNELLKHGYDSETIKTISCIKYLKGGIGTLNNIFRVNKII